MSKVYIMTTKKIIFDSKNLSCDISDVEWVLKSDYDDLEQLSDAFYLKQVQLENQNEDLKAKLEKAETILKKCLRMVYAYKVKSMISLSESENI